MRASTKRIVIVVLLSVMLVACQSEESDPIQTEESEFSSVESGNDNASDDLIEATQIVQDVVEKEDGVPTEEIEELLENEVVTLHTYTTNIATLDPQVGEDVVALNNIESLFVHLTNYELGTNNIVPEAAMTWTVSDDGLIYTFDVRTDIPWVIHDPITGQTMQDVDEEGNPRFVTAHDFEFGFKRACDPNVASYYSTVIAPHIVGCEEMLNLENPADEAALGVARDVIGVTALDESTLEVTLTFPASYFLSMTPMWILAATPQWIIENEQNWQQPGRIVTNGRFVLQESVEDVRRTLLRNPLMPADMAGEGNIEKLVTTVVPDTGTGYAMWLNNEVDISGIPDEELENHLLQSPDETIQIPDLVVFYLSFRETKPPFDDPQVRRAFSAAFDRDTFVEEVRQGQGQPMKHFAPPGIFGAPSIDEVGIGYDPEFAREQLAAAGYPNCEGFPQISLLGYSGQDALDWLEYAQGQWETNLGCSADLIQIEQQDFNELLVATSEETPDKETPHIWTLGWGPDYPDENNWVGDVLWCGNAVNRQKRQCSEADDLILEAREEPDPDRRIELYRQIEEMFFGPEGEYPIAPIWVRIAYLAEHNWLKDRMPALFGGQQYYHWTIDQDAKLAASNE
jgi:oligopeptide transport system substrate-binding protein